MRRLAKYQILEAVHLSYALLLSAWLLWTHPLASVLTLCASVGWRAWWTYRRKAMDAEFAEKMAAKAWARREWY
jgi:hypothetical protein